MDQKGSKLSKLSNLRICRGECPFQCFHKNNRNESRIKRWLIHSIMLCASKNGRLILQDKNYRLIGNLTAVRRGKIVFEASPNPSLKSLEIWRPSSLRTRTRTIVSAQLSLTGV